MTTRTLLRISRIGWTLFWTAVVYMTWRLEVLAALAYSHHCWTMRCWR